MVHLNHTLSTSWLEGVPSCSADSKGHIEPYDKQENLMSITTHVRLADLAWRQDISLTRVVIA